MTPSVISVELYAHQDHHFEYVTLLPLILFDTHTPHTPHTVGEPVDPPTHPAHPHPPLEQPVNHIFPEPFPQLYHCPAVHNHTTHPPATPLSPEHHAPLHHTGGFHHIIAGAPHIAVSVLNTELVPAVHDALVDQTPATPTVIA